jgi:hypothetical protein
MIDGTLFAFFVLPSIVLAGFGAIGVVSSVAATGSAGRVGATEGDSLRISFTPGEVITAGLEIVPTVVGCAGDSIVGIGPSESDAICGTTWFDCSGLNVPLNMIAAGRANSKANRFVIIHTPQDGPHLRQ